jgi:FtsP/CotA-like multicopper oxidase with cupredoxin domain
VVTRNPLRIPQTLSPRNTTLVAAPARVDLGGGRLSSVRAYNGAFPGPTFRASVGDAVNVGLSNGLAQKTTIHWHGMIVPTAADGHPRDAVAPGGSYQYQYTIAQRACLNWYHAHPHMLTGEQVCLGLAGGFIVNDAEEAGLGLPTGLPYEIPLIVRDARLDPAGNLQYTPMGGAFLGNLPLVNGTRDPFLAVDHTAYRFRLLNGANARVFGLTLSNGLVFNLIGNDGGLLDVTQQLRQVDIAPGERLDLLVDFREIPAGQNVMLRDVRTGWAMLEFRVTQSTPIVNTIPTSLSTIPGLANPAATRVFSFDGMNRINGKVYDLNRIDFRVPLGQTELWRFRTGGHGFGQMPMHGGAPHPVHVHGASFQVQSRTGGRGQVLPWERGWKDTVLLEAGETIDVLIRFDRFRGIYLIHCHKLEHEDHGMMANFEVI